MSTTAEKQAVKQVVMAIAETIREVGEVPSGSLYAMLCGKLSLSQYQSIIGILIRTGMVRQEPSHLLVWTGPK